MSISFACPGCKVQIEVGDEHAGQAGQCPRCERVISIPSPQQQRPVAAAVPVPAADPWEKPRRTIEDEPARRPRRTRPAPPPPQPAGPMWPWIVGVFGAVIVAGLLFSSFAVLVFWRKTEPIRFAENQKKPFEQQRPLVGRLQGQRAFLDNGVFQIRSTLEHHDPVDPITFNRCKRFDIEFQPNRNYVIEMDSNQFDCEVRLENAQGMELQFNDGQRGIRPARLDYHSPRFESLVIFATCPNPAVGEFTLTIREVGMK